MGMGALCTTGAPAEPQPRARPSGSSPRTPITLGGPEARMATKQRGQGIDALSGAELASLLPLGVFTTDADGRCTYVSERWCALTGLGAEAVRGRGWIETLHPDDRAAVSRAWRRFAAGPEPLSVEFRFRLPDGRSRWVRAQADAERDE